MISHGVWQHYGTMTGLTSPARARGWPAKMVWIFQAPTFHGVLGGWAGSCERLANRPCAIAAGAGVG
ncbi:hypothetical protein [Acetobacter senegalensis]|uniref:hypothetical protein n=1 Tax=Acetobacter senegalensis TaxID=446692 RepID=UPI001EDD3E09|nr:hypothetical protein [Acetobacter senegalensis]MCG4273390.1 hypothetical protein [Acetobacter senegalensis]